MSQQKGPKRPSFDEVLEKLKSRLVGQSPRFLKALQQLYRAAGTDELVRIEGVTGVGKEACAEFFHYATGQNGKLIIVNCAAIPTSTAESTLFGHQRGAFTGATTKHIGLLEAADGGTLFFDEIHTLQPELQEMLLRFFQEKTFRPLGSNEDQKVDVRIVVATNRNLKTEVATGAMRHDFFFRAQGIRVVIPALRDRGSDVWALFTHFLKAKFGEKAPGLTSQAEAFIRAYEWPGNVRELMTLVSALHMARDPDDEERVIDIEELESILELEPGQGPSALTDRVHSALVRHKRLRVPDLCEMLDHGRSRIYEALRELLQEGRVRVDNQGRYLPVHRPQAPSVAGTELETKSKGEEPRAAHRSSESGLIDEALRLAETGVRRSELMAATGTSRRNASRCLTELRKKGFLERVGEHPNHRYLRTAKANRPLLDEVALHPDRPSVSPHRGNAAERRFSDSGSSSSEPNSPEPGKGEAAGFKSDSGRAPCEAGADATNYAYPAPAASEPPLAPGADEVFTSSEGVERLSGTAEGAAADPEPVPPAEVIEAARRVVAMIQMYHLPKGEAEVMQALIAHGPVSLKELFPLIGDCRSTAHRSLVKLEQRGFVIREESRRCGDRWRATDSWQLELTDKRGVATDSNRHTGRTLALMLSGSGISKKVLTLTMAWTEKKSYRVLTSLVRLGLLEPKGEGCQRRYSLSTGLITESSPTSSTEP